MMQSPEGLGKTAVTMGGGIHLSPFVVMLRA